MGNLAGLDEAVGHHGDVVHGNCEDVRYCIHYYIISFTWTPVWTSPILKLLDVWGREAEDPSGIQCWQVVGLLLGFAGAVVRTVSGLAVKTTIGLLLVTFIDGRWCTSGGIGRAMDRHER